MDLPQDMKAVVLRSYEGPETRLAVSRMPLRTPSAGEVVVRMSAASINPSDLIFLKGQYGVTKPLPIIPGFEGAGTVVATAGLLSRWLLGRRVACRAPEEGHGTWAEYMVCSASQCIPLLKGVTTEAGASLIVNPLTAWALLQLARRERHRAFIQTAAASALGRMLARLAKSEGVPAIHIVRRPEQAVLLRGEGAEHVLDSSQPDFAAALASLAAELQATIAFDAVAGDLTATVLAAMPRGSRAVVYGALAGENAQASPRDLIFRGKSIGGFWLTQWVKHMSLPAKLAMVYRVQKRLKDTLRTDIRARYPLVEIRQAIDDYKAHRSEGKVLVVM